MEHYFQNIHGWFNYESLYTEMVNRFPDGSKFAEIGCWVGRSACYLGVEIVNSGKEIKLECIDTWLGAPELMEEDVIKNGTLYTDFLRNIEPIKEIVNVVRLTSTQASYLYPDNYFDFVFIDADHTKQGINNDLECWLQKVKSGGVLAGHDADYPVIREALNKHLGENNYRIIEPNTWAYEKL